jgi:hypothetical protein
LPPTLTIRGLKACRTGIGIAGWCAKAMRLSSTVTDQFYKRHSNQQG